MASYTKRLDFGGLQLTAESLRVGVSKPAGSAANAVTLSSNAGTLNKHAGKITTESLTTAAGSAQDLTITCDKCAATDMIFITRNGGTSATGTLEMKAVPGAGSFVITLTNRHASAAFNGTFIISYVIFKV